MTSPVTKAMIESYALMVMVMGTFFVYFCGMVWAFCNPKLSGAEEQYETEGEEAPPGDSCSVCAPHPQLGTCRCPAARPPAPQVDGDWLTHATYINFLGDTDSLLSDCSGCRCEDHGTINNKSGCSPLREE